MKMIRINKKVYCMLCFALTSITMILALSACSVGGEKNSVIIFSANYEETVPAQMEFLKSRFPEVSFTITCMATGNLAAKVLAEGKDTEADIIVNMASGFTNALKNAGLLRSYTPGSTYLPEYADPENIRIPNGVWCGALLVNTKELERLSLPEPKKYMDLLDPVYKGHIVMSNPTTSSTGYFFLLGLLNLYGETAGWKYFENLKNNIMLFAESGSGPASMVDLGECVIGMGMDYQGFRLQKAGKPVKVIFAEEGSPYDNDTILLLNKGSEPDKLVLDVLKAITSPEGNAVFNDYSKAVIKGVKDSEDYPAGFTVLDMSGIGDANRKEALLEIWNEKFE